MNRSTRGPRRPRGRRIQACALAGAAAVLGAAPARAWDPATTQAGLTERALLASSFHKALGRRLGRPLGAFEPVQLNSRELGPDERRTLWARLEALDPAGGYRPGSDGIATALAWTTAGAVLAETPPERGRNHFFDPARGGAGLDEGGLAGTVHALQLSMDQAGSVRGLATGSVFDMTGKGALGWMLSPANDLGFVTFQAQLARAAAAETSAERETALVRALLAVGGMMAVLEDAGEPAHVRNDFSGAFLDRQSRSTWDRSSGFETFVARRYGRAGIPAPQAPVRRPNLASFFSAADGEGLADRTQRRFFSDGTIPDEVSVEPRTTPRDVVQAARASLPYQRPTVTRLDLGTGERRYMVLDGRRALGYQRLPGRIRFFLDDTVYADTARALLPEVGAYAAGLVDYLLRAGFAVTFRQDAANKTAVIALEGAAGNRAEGKLRVFAEDRTGKRRPIALRSPVPTALSNGEEITIDVPAGTRRIAVVLEGKDGAGPVVAVGEGLVP